MWYDGLLYKLAGAGVNGRMFNWIEDYLKDWTFKTRIGNVHSSSHKVKAGVPQGGVLCRQSHPLQHHAA